ncbi:MAG: hypothetical protein LR015_11865 [Verrucomicrobia bacterium]|nr:hypothetical protein [Verrucomicrobiota bacterium]
MKTKLIACIATLAIASVSQAELAASVIFSEDFGSLANGTGITTSNTGLTYVRIGTQGGSINAQNPSSFGSGASLSLVGPTGGSLNGFGVESGLDIGGLTVMEFDLRLGNTNGTFAFGLGSGNSFTGNSTFATAQGLYWFQITGGELQRRTSSWIAVDTIATATNYSIAIYSKHKRSRLSISEALVEQSTMEL